MKAYGNYHRSRKKRKKIEPPMVERKNHPDELFEKTGGLYGRWEIKRPPGLTGL